ncbi:MAG: hypothetical protein IKT62_06265 [Firmicutes bacterium]|nr:hypothetical protein [Bacillota bacterium]
MADNLVKFVYAASATSDQIAAFSPDTLYFIGGSTAGEGGKLYKGPRLYDSGAVAAAAELAQLKTYIGTLPVADQYTDLIDYIDKNIAAAQSAAESYTDTLDQSLAAVAKSGTAADVAVVDAGGLLTATNAEAAFAELATAINTNDAAAEVTMESASGSGDTLTVYDFYQGVLGTDDAAAKAAKKIGTINIPKDYLVRSANIETVDTADEPYTGAEVGDKYIDFVVNTKDGDSGTPQHMYIALDDLVAVMQGSVGSEITVTIGANNTIQASINKVSGNKIVYRAADTSDPENPVTEQSVNAKIAELEEALGDGLDALDGSATIATVSDGVVTIKSGVEEVDGVIDNDSGSDITLAKVATTGAAIDVSYGQSTVKAALDTIGTIPGTASATTVVGYVDEVLGDTVGALDADLDAALGAGDTDAEAVAVVSGVTEADGVITSVDSVAVDAAGAATRAKAAVIGTASDTASASTIYGAKAYADSLVSTTVAALDADLDASGTATASGTFVVSGVTEVDGVITSVDSVEVENAGAAAAAQAAAIAYTDAALTWQSLPTASV